MTETWPFDQGRDVATITTRQVLQEGAPVLIVIHYSDDHSWAFLGSDSPSNNDVRVVGMGEIIDMDSSLRTIAALRPGWVAERNSVHGSWHTTQDSEV